MNLQGVFAVLSLLFKRSYKAETNADVMFSGATETKSRQVPCPPKNIVFKCRLES